jgi:hypothetical protein
MDALKFFFHSVAKPAVAWWLLAYLGSHFAYFCMQGLDKAYYSMCFSSHHLSDPWCRGLKYLAYRVGELGCSTQADLSSSLQVFLYTKLPYTLYR